MSSAADRITRTLFATQSMASAAVFASVTVAAIVGAQLSGRPAWAGIPSAGQLLGVALSAFVWGNLMERFGRRPGLLWGITVGMLGAGIALAGVLSASFWVFILGLVLMGASRAATDLGRYAAAEVHPAHQRAGALSTVVFGGTLGAIAGPLLVGPTGTWMASMGLSDLSGAYVSGIGLLAIAWLTLFFGLRPEPRILAKDLDIQTANESSSMPEARPLRQILRDPGIVFAMTTMVGAQLVMVLVMVITSLYMKANQHSLTDVSFVISSHTVGMYALSVVSGRLADRFGRAAVILVGNLILITGALTSGLTTQLFPLAGALFLVGFGWNLCYVAGSSLLADRLSASERSRTQGLNDTVVGMVSAVGSLSSGIAFAAVGYAAIGQMGAVICLLALIQALRWTRRGPQALVLG